MNAVPTDLLAAIVAAARRIVETRMRRVPMAAMEARAAAATPVRSFKEALMRPDRVNVIAECKRRSPSRGVLKADYDPAVIAKGYDAAGAAAISVLTEPTFFDGSLEHLSAVRDAVAVPVLRKDFVVHRYQIAEARAAGADAVLLIVAALEASELRDLQAAAHDQGLDALVEVHDAVELERALEGHADVIGVNSRNLRTLAVDPQTCDALVERIPPHVVAVAESGLRTPDDLLRLRRLGYRAFLVGERLMETTNPGQALARLLPPAHTWLTRSS